jgi:hypothetical protein
VEIPLALLAIGPTALAFLLPLSSGILPTLPKNPSVSTRLKSTGGNSMPKLITPDQFEALQQSLDGLESKKRPRKKADVIQDLTESIKSAMDKGYTLKEIAGVLEAQGFKISEKSLDKYFHGPKKSVTERPAKTETHAGTQPLPKRTRPVSKGTSGTGDDFVDIPE